jgi:hypothetical protein
MGAIVNRGTTIIVPDSFVGVGINASPTPGFVRDPQERINDRSIARINKNIIPPSAIAAALLLDADFANGVYMLNGEVAALADIGTVTTNSHGLVPGVGLRAEKAVGTGITNFYANLDFSPTVRDLINVPGGFTAVIDSVVDNIANGSVAHAEGNLSIGLNDVDWQPYKRSLVSWAGPVVQQDHGGWECVADYADYEYDYVYEREWPISGPELGANATSYHSMLDNVIHTYFGDNLDAVVTAAPAGIVAPVPFPMPTDRAVLAVTANCHEGTNEDKNLVGFRRTVSRLRIFTPGQPAGWALS